MKCVVWIAVILALCGVAPAQDAAADLPQKIMTLEKLWSEATATRDVQTVTRLLDDSFLYVDFDGRLMNKAEALVDLQSSGMQQAAAESMLVRMHGSSAIVTGIFWVKGVKNGKAFKHLGRFVDTWVYKNGVWLCAVSQVTPLVQ